MSDSAFIESSARANPGASSRRRYTMISSPHLDPHFTAKKKKKQGGCALNFPWLTHILVNSTAQGEKRRLKKKKQGIIVAPRPPRTKYHAMSGQVLVPTIFTANVKGLLTAPTVAMPYQRWCTPLRTSNSCPPTACPARPEPA